MESNQAMTTQGDDDILFIKTCYIIPSTSSIGVTIIQVGLSQKKIEKIDTALAVRSSLNMNLAVDQSWATFYETISSIKFSGNYNHKISLDIDNILTKSISGTNFESIIVKDIIKFFQKGSMNSIIDILQPEISRVVFDKNIKLSLATETISRYDRDNYKKIENEEAKENAENVAPLFQTDSFFNAPDLDALIATSLIVAPVSGMPIFELKPGMEIMVKLDHASSLGRHYNTKFGLLQDDGRVLPIRATIEKVKSDQEGHKLLVRIDKGIYGKIIETEQVKVKRFGDELNSATSQSDDAGIPKTTLLIAGLLIFVLVGLLFFIIAK